MADLTMGPFPKQSVDVSPSKHPGMSATRDVPGSIGNPLPSKMISSSKGKGFSAPAHPKNMPAVG